MNTRVLAATAASFAALMMLLLVLLASTNSSFETSDSSSLSVTDAQVPIGSGALGANTPGAPCLSAALCLAEELKPLAETDPGEALARYNAAADQDNQYRISCHSAYHVIGQSAGSTTDDPWATFLAGTNDCNYGYVHGVVEGLMATVVDATTAVDEVATLCSYPDGVVNDDDSKAVLGNCFHGAGHALLKLRSVPTDALADCAAAFADQTDVSSPVGVCADGVFMELSNHPQAYGGADGAVMLCQSLSDETSATKCWENMGAVFLGPGVTFEVGFANCDAAGEFIASCAQAVANIAAFQVLSLPEGTSQSALETCETLSEEMMLGCMRGIVQSLVGAAAQGAVVRDEVDAAVDAVVPAEFRANIEEVVRITDAGLPPA